MNHDPISIKAALHIAAETMHPFRSAMNWIKIQRHETILSSIGEPDETRIKSKKNIR